MCVPCKDCKERHVGCHSKCPQYIEFDKKNKAMKKARADYLRPYKQQIDIYEELRHKYKRKR